jgi:putative heme-binding domain-containing protein
VATAPAVRAAAQHETAADIQEGGRFFQAACANCHGPDGDLVAGIDLGRGLFRRPYTDAELARIIRAGIPGTPMPPSPNMSEDQAQQVVSFLRSTAAARKATAIVGDIGRGKSLYDGKGGCAACHRVAAVGSRLGPDLTAIGRSRRAEQLQRALIDPDAEVVPSNRFYRVETRDGEVTTGRLLNLDTFTVQLLDSTERLRSFQKADLRSHGWAPTPMPSYRSTFTSQEIADVVSYLVSLKGVTR